MFIARGKWNFFFTVSALEDFAWHRYYQLVTIRDTATVDFGFACVMEMDLIYQIKTSCPLPVKWMSLEAFENEQFTVYINV